MRCPFSLKRPIYNSLPIPKNKFPWNTQLTTFIPQCLFFENGSETQTIIFIDFNGFSRLKAQTLSQKSNLHRFSSSLGGRMRGLKERRRREASVAIMLMFMQLLNLLDLYRRYKLALPRGVYIDNMNERNSMLRRMYMESDKYCHERLRMYRPAFQRLCTCLRGYGLVDGRSVRVEEQVALFLIIVGQDWRNRDSTFQFFRSGETVSRYFHSVLSSLLMLHKDIVKPATSANSPLDGSIEQHWYNYFKDAVGAIDGTHINASVSSIDQPRYRNRKQNITQNVLLACNFNMQFTYVLAGSEGSVHDGRMLRNAVARQGHKLTVPVGKYYLADAGFALAPGFLTPYCSTRYHLRDHDGRRPETPKELYNFRHASLRNVIERSIDILKKRFAYLRNTPFHDINTQAKIVLACCAVHNFLRERDLEDVCDGDTSDDEDEDEDGEEDGCEPNYDPDVVITTSQVWTATRDAMAEEMWATR